MSYRSRRVHRAFSSLLISTLALGSSSQAASNPSTTPSSLFLTVSELPIAQQATYRARLSTLGVEPQHAFLDPQTGGWGTLLMSQPILGEISYTRLESPALRARAWEGLRRYLEGHLEILGWDPRELGSGSDISAHDRGDIVQIHAPRFYRGLPVWGSYLSAVINHGNLVLLGTRRWTDVEVSLEPTVSPLQAIDALDPATVGTIMLAPQLGLLPVLREGQEGETFSHRLVWQILSDSGQEAMVDAHNGEILRIEHSTRSAVSASVVGGVFPASNDGSGPEGTEQLRWPMPNTRVTDLATGERYSTDSAGYLPACLEGPFNVRGFGTFAFNVFDGNACVIPNETFSGPLIDLGAGPGTDCDRPPGHPNGTSHALRTAAYELSRIRETSSAQLPQNTWLRNRRALSLFTRPLAAELNRNTTFGTDQPFGCAYAQHGTASDDIFCLRSTATRANPAEIASVLDHEFGHAIDANDLIPAFSNPSEGIADAYAALRQNRTCIGRGLFNTQCGGYGDPCTDCTGVRDIDWTAHTGAAPHDLTFVDAACSPVALENGPCGGDAHCEGIVVSEAIWDLYRRDLQGPPYNSPPATALELTTRLTYLGAGAVSEWFQCSDGTGVGDGCNVDSGYLNLLAIDDDNGDLTDGTPHMTAIFNAFDRHGIACPTPAVQDSGCVGTPTQRPVVQATPFHRAVELSWAPVPGALSYEVFRAEGVARCAVGKLKVAQLEGTTFRDTDLLNGREYSYAVVPKGPGLSCLGPNSLCASATPVEGPHLEAPTDSFSLAIETGDGDRFLDNCESAQVSFTLLNSGLGTLTNVRIVDVSSPSHPLLQGLASLPRPVAANLPPCASAAASFPLRPQGMAHDDTLELVFEITADEIFPRTLPIEVSYRDVESDFETHATHTFSFESDLEGWESIEGQFRRVPGAGGNGSAAYIESVPFGRQRCDVLASPWIQLSDTSTLSLWNNYDMTLPNTFDGYIFDTANIHLTGLGGFAGRPNQVDGGRPYFVPGDIGPENFWICNHYSNGWTGLDDTWASSSFSSTGLDAPTVAGQPIRVNVVYGQSRRNQKPGFSFDEVTLTDFDLQVPDAQGNQLCTGPIFVDGFESGDTSAWTASTP